MNRIAPGLGCLVMLAAVCGAQQFVRLELLPDALVIDTADDRPAVLVVATTATGVQVDATASAALVVRDPAVAALATAGDRTRLVGRAPGSSELLAVLGDLEARAPIAVRSLGARPVPSFRNEVLPILTSAGCNAGSCHGAASGKNGFQLSLFAYDPPADHRMLTRELWSRRINPASPDHSLLLRKATAEVPHQGGRRLVAGGAELELLRDWVRSGAPDDGDDAPRLERLELLPPTAVLLAGTALPLIVRACYSDGSGRDVTGWALWTTSDDGAVTLGANGVATARGAGDAALLARFGGRVALAQVQVLAADDPWTWPEPPAANCIDEHVHSRLRAARRAPAPLATDEVFLRRVSLDLGGLLPTPEEVRSFVADEQPDKRERWIDALLQRPEFAAAEAMAWAETLQVDAQQMQGKGAYLLSTWLRDGIATGRPFDAMVRELLTAEGPTFEVAAANYWLAADQPHLLAEHTAQNFLGIRLQCAQCHDHPFESWSMDDYYGFAGFFAQLARKRAEDGSEWIVWNRRSGEVRNRRTNAVARPRLLRGATPAIAAGEDRRAVLAAWLTAPDNPWFARHVANRAWARLFGRGLVEPVDDVRLGNPPSHPGLLQALADLLVRERFDLRALYRAIARSRTYQAARAEDGAPARLFSGHHARRLTAEQLLDAIGAATGVPTRYPGLPAGAPATAITSGRTAPRFLEVFGRPARTSACTCDRRNEPTLGQALHLVNGDTLARKIAARDGRLERLLAAGTAPPRLLDELFLACFARLPREAERSYLLAEVANAGDGDAARAAWQDIFWALLNAREFLFQH